MNTHLMKWENRWPTRPLTTSAARFKVLRGNTNAGIIRYPAPLELDVAKATIDQVIEQEVVSRTALIVAEHVTHVCREQIVVHLLSTFDLDGARPDSSWTGVDDVATRTTLLQRVMPQVVSDCAHRVSDALSGPMNAALTAAGYRSVKPNRLVRHIEPALRKLVAGPHAQTAFHANPFPDAWRDLSSAMAVSLFSSLKAGLLTGEWAVLNRLVLASFFQSCTLPTATQAVGALTDLRQSVLSVRGSLVRLPERVSAAGIADVRPSPIAATGAISLAHRSLSTLLKSCHTESQATARREGIAHRVLGVNGPVTAEHQAELRRLFPGRDPVRLMRESRIVRFQEYNFTILAYMALTGIEQLLHAQSERLKLPHVGPNGWLVEVDDLIDHLHLSSSLVARVRALYSTRDTNVRNRVMHGGLLEIEGQRTQNAYRLLTAAAGPNPEPYSSENIANVCLSLLADLDAEISAAGLLSQADMGWVLGKGLSSADMAFVGTLPDPREWAEADAEEWRSQLFRFLTVYCPAANVSAKIGFHGWLRHFDADDSFIQILFLGMTFETLYRTTLHLLGHEILQQTLNKAGTLYVFRYHVLDERQGGLCTPDALDKLVRSRPAHERARATECFKLAIGLRDAFAHGAIPDFPPAVLDSVGHVFVHAVDLLRHAAIDHLTREAAYYNWINNGRLPGTSDADWAHGRHQIDRLVAGLT